MRARIAIALAICGVIESLSTRAAHAYVRAASDSGAPLYWPSSCTAVTIYLNGFAMMTPEEVAKSIAAAAHAWSPEEVTCPGDAASHPYLEIVPSLAAGGPVPGVAYDGKNSIIFQTAVWPEYADFIALTSHFYRADGQILDTDIEINAATGVTWANLDPGAPASGHGQNRIDLQTAMTHEFGHFIGLKHTCFDPAVDLPPAPVDDQGQTIPDCPDPPATPGNVPQAQSVMWFYVDPESTDKRVLAADDVRAVCAIYPAAQNPNTCALNLPDDGCGCAAGGGHASRGAGLSCLAFLLAATRPPGRRRRGPGSTRDRGRRATPTPTSRPG